MVIVGLGLYSYYVRELLASLVLFTGAFFFWVWWRLECSLSGAQASRWQSGLHLHRAT